jgi:hypothetical protein
MIILRSHETGDWFLENSHLCHLGTISQGADASCLTDEHSVVELHADQHGTVGFPSLLGPIAGAPHHQPRPMHLWEWERRQNISTGSNNRVPECSQEPHSNIGTFMDSALVFNHLNDSQSRCQQSAFLYYQLAICTNQNLRSYIYFHFSLLRWNLQDATYLHVLLTCPKYPMYQSAAWPFQKLSRTYISTVLPERFFTSDDGCTKKVMKLFHKFSDSSGLMHVHSTREKQSSNRKCQFL